eukprot:9476465-Pyramimonas_sp.AAC.1
MKRGSAEEHRTVWSLHGYGGGRGAREREPSGNALAFERGVGSEAGTGASRGSTERTRRLHTHTLGSPV